MGAEQWPGIELRHLAALVAVAREQSFRAAAASLGYVPSAISAQIGDLESKLGVRLFERSRGPGPVALTEAGRVLLAHAEAILARLQAAESDVHRLVDGGVRVLRVGLTQSAGVRILPTLIRRDGGIVAEVPVSHRPRRFGTTKYGMWNRVFRALADAFGVRWLLRRTLRYRVREELP